MLMHICSSITVSTRVSFPHSISPSPTVLYLHTNNLCYLSISTSFESPNTCTYLSCIYRKYFTLHLSPLPPSLPPSTPTFPYVIQLSLIFSAFDVDLYFSSFSLLPCPFSPPSSS